VLRAVEDVHGAVLDSVLVTGDQTTTDPPVIGVLALRVEQAGAAVQALDDLLGDGAVVTEPDGAGQHRDVRGHHPLEQRGPGA